MNTDTRADRVQCALELRNALRRAPGDIAPNSESPPGDCGRPIDDPRGCGMKDENECKTHCNPAAEDPVELLSIAGTRRQARQQLRASRRQGLQR
jgi:hypothetical protein